MFVSLNSLVLWRPVATGKAKNCETKRHISFYLGKDVAGYVEQCVVTAPATSSLGSSTLSEQQRIEQQLCLLEIFGDVYIFMHPKHLWKLGEW